MEEKEGGRGQRTIDYVGTDRRCGKRKNCSQDEGIPDRKLEKKKPQVMCCDGSTRTREAIQSGTGPKKKKKSAAAPALLCSSGTPVTGKSGLQVALSSVKSLCLKEKSEEGGRGTIWAGSSAMWGAGRRLALLGKAPPVSLQLTRSKWWKKIIHNVYPSLRDRLEEMDHTRSDPEVYAPVNIGLAKGRPPRREQLKSRLECIVELRKNKQLEKMARKGELKIDLDKVQAEWESGAGPHHLRALAQHYGIFTHLFGNAYFVPRVVLNIAYDYDEDMISPVFRGNTIKPREAFTAPSVQYHSEPNTLWTLVLTNPDGNLMKNDLECLHWFVGNIVENDISSGEVVCDYLQPFPPRGTGYHRMVFILYKQHGKIDFSKYRREQPCLSLKERHFSTLDMYRELQDTLTPAGLAWFQSDWDSSLTDFFHNTLNMREPVYEYDFPKPYLAPQKHFPHKRQFNTYMDLHRDPKQISKEILLERLQNLHPFGPEPSPLPFPSAQPIHPDLTSWERRDLKRKRIGLGKYQDLFRGSNRPA